MGGRLCFPVWMLLFCIVCHSSVAQNYIVRVHSADNNTLLSDYPVKTSEAFANAADAVQYIGSLVPALQRKGFLAASVDSFSISEQIYDLYVYRGEKYAWAQVRFNEIPEAVLSQAGVKKESWEGKNLEPERIAAVSERLLQWAENNGYPFAQVWLDQVEIHPSGKVNASFRMEKFAVQHIDSVVVHGDVKISGSFLQQYLDIKEGDIYQENKLSKISARLRELPYLEESSPWTIEFTVRGNYLNLYLKEKKANQINAIAGLQPNNSETGKFLWTVDALFAFQNILAQGETIRLSYQNLQYKSPRFRADLAYPYLFQSRFGLDGRFDLFKKDTSFRKTSFQAGIRYQVSATDYLRVFYQSQSSRIITPDTAFVKLNKSLPENIDVAASGAGIEMGFHRTDYKNNPRKGWEASIQGSGLLRNVRKNDAITRLKDASGFDYTVLYDSILNRRNQYFITGNAACYLSPGKKTVFKLAYSGGYVGGVPLFRNELFQIGGFRLLRGFEEESIFTNQYHVGSLELRFLLDRNSYFYFFSDNGYVQTDFNQFFKEDFYTGFGLGATLETLSGIFSIGYGLGAHQNNPVLFRQSQIHLGYVAYF